MEKTHENENSELLKKYKQYIFGAYNGIIKNDKLYNMFLDLEIKQWNSKNASQIIDYFFPDIAYIALQTASRETLDLCFRKYENNIKIDDETYQKLFKEMNDNYNQVKPQNKASAKLLLSEGMLDLKYAHTDTNVTSVRFGMAMATKKSK